jgi:hypothetical protein
MMRSKSQPCIKANHTLIGLNPKQSFDFPVVTQLTRQLEIQHESLISKFRAIKQSMQGNGKTRIQARAKRGLNCSTPNRTSRLC